MNTSLDVVHEKPYATASKYMGWISLCIPLLSLLFGLWHLKGSWDDGAITAAFARTFAQTGRMALTSHSVPVEGSSSLLWMLLLAIPAYVSSNVLLILVWMKIGAAACFLGSLLVLRAIARRFLASPFQQSACVLLFALAITPFHESLNGMEMNLALLLGLAMALVLLKQRIGVADVALVSFLSALLLLARFESPYFLLFLAIALLLRGASPLWIACAGLIDTAAFLASELWRWRYFHSWMPNTVYAKRWEPYAPAHHLKGMISTRLVALAEFPYVYLWPVLVVLVLFIVVRRQLSWKTKLSPNARFLVAMFVGAVLFAIVFGHNMGHPGRMDLMFLPFMALAAVYFVSESNLLQGTVWPRVLAIMLVGQFIVWGVQAGRLVWHGDPTPTARIEQEGTGIEKIREALGVPSISAFIPDVGGSALCCDRIDIYDSALLTNPVLSRTGYAGTQEYFRDIRPETVIVHMPWSMHTQLYESGLLDDYGIVGVDNTRVFVRPDLYAKLRLKYKETPIADARNCGAHNFAPEDAAFSMKRGVCIELN